MLDQPQGISLTLERHLNSLNIPIRLDLSVGRKVRLDRDQKDYIVAVIGPTKERPGHLVVGIVREDEGIKYVYSDELVPIYW